MPKKKDEEYIRTCVIAFPKDAEKRVIILFSGDWARKHIEISYKHMMRNLKKEKLEKYKEISKTREQILEEVSDGERAE